MPGLDTARAKASRVRLIIFDVDGVLTDGSISYASDGEERKRFHVRDGSAVIRALRRGLKIAWVSGRRATAVERRASELGVADLFQGIEDKRPVFERLRREGGFKKEETAYLGDDHGDVELFESVGFSAAPADAHPAARARADYLCSLRGGEGAAGEAIDFIIECREDGR